MAYIQSSGYPIPATMNEAVEQITRSGGTPLAVARNGQAVGVIHLKDVVKGGIKERFAQLRRMGIKTVMITGDNPLTATAIAAEAGVDDFLAQATPETKLKLIREYQNGGRLVLTPMNYWPGSRPKSLNRPAASSKFFLAHVPAWAKPMPCSKPLSLAGLSG
jgi:high-affinity K+ transport system ATPase subunit B